MMPEKPLPFRGGVGVGSVISNPDRRTLPTPSPSPEGEGNKLVRAILQSAAQTLTALTETSRLDAELLMAHALGVDRNTLLLRHLNDPAPTAFTALLDRRVAHEPLAYITGTRDFWTIRLHVARGVLIPRPDSETLIEVAIAHFKGRAPKTILDLGTGSGALLLAALTQWPEAVGIGVDASGAALAIAQGNADALGLSGRAQIRKGNWGQGLQGMFDLILCNPPYVETGADLTAEVLNEPHEALFAGVDGLDDYNRLAPQITSLLARGGCAAVEIGATQAGAVGDIFAAEGLRVQVCQDLGARDRCLLLTRP